MLGLPYLPMQDFADNPSSRIFWANIPIEKAHSYLLYRHDSDANRLLAQLKYNHRPDLGRWLGRMMARELRPKGFFTDVECIIAVPLHWRRHWSRGYNQSYELACGVAEVTGLPLLRRQVRRVRNNESQTRKSGEERIQNVQNLFIARPALPYRHVLLVDDVLTTGSTLTSCAKALLQANPDVRFSILTLARAFLIP